MANQLTIAPRITMKGDTTTKVIGAAAVQIAQTNPGSSAESKRLTSATPILIGGLSDMIEEGVAHVSNLSAAGSGDDDLVIGIAGTPFMHVDPGEQYNFRMVPGAAYEVSSSSTNGCDYSITVFEN